MKKKSIIALSIILALSIFSSCTYNTEKTASSIDIYKIYKDKNTFRKAVVKHVREIAQNHFDSNLTEHPKHLKIEGNWMPTIKIYHEGEIKGTGTGKNEDLSIALQRATKNALEDKKINKSDLKNVRFLISFPWPHKKPFAFIEYNGGGKEVIKDCVIIREFDKEMMRKKIELAKKYILSAMDKELYGFHKFYYALTDRYEDRLHGVYTASSIYTLMKLYDYSKDEELMKTILKCADYLLSMQNKKEKHYGAFHYSYFTDKKEMEQKFVVGTTSKTIYTLLELHRRTGDDKYLEAAKLGGNWLTTMQREDGSMTPHARLRDGKWYRKKKDSVLYNGQVLSACSRLYRVTGEKRYYETAERIAKYLSEKVKKEGLYIGDDYREANPISTSWLVQSFLDFYLASNDKYYLDTLLEACDLLLEKQMHDDSDIFRYGRWPRGFSSSGTGWMAEVLVEVYKFCKENNVGNPEEYKDSIIKAIRLIIQHTYSEENSFILKKPDTAIGGFFWDYKNRYVRTDAVCHGINAYVSIINDLDEGILLSVPERSFKETIDDLKKGI